MHTVFLYLCVLMHLGGEIGGGNSVSVSMASKSLKKDPRNSKACKMQQKVQKGGDLDMNDTHDTQDTLLT